MFSKFKNHKYLILSLTIIVLIATWFILVDRGNYGTTLFFTIPSSITFLIGYTKTFNGTSIKKIKQVLFGFLKIAVAIALFSGLLIAIGLEGAICVLMAYPFFVIPMTLSYMIGLGIGNADKNSIRRNSLILLIILNPTSYIYDSYSEPINDKIISELVINTSKERIWEALSTEISFESNPNLLFKKGISYPKSIQFYEIDNKNSYRCITNNDTIDLDITEFKKNTKVTFKLRKQTIPMKEMTPYDSIDAEHLHNYFFVNYGQINLEAINENTTKVKAVTSYSYKIAPKWYWKLWSNYTIDQMQLQVLNSIKNSHDK